MENDRDFEKYFSQNKLLENIPIQLTTVTFSHTQSVERFHKN